MARKVARCLRKNYKKKVKANAKNDKAAAEGANEIAALFNGAGDLALAKRSVAASQKHSAKSKGSIVGQRVNTAKKAIAQVGGKKHLAEKAKKKVNRKALFDEDEDDDAVDEEDLEVDEEEEEANDGHQTLPPIDSLTTADQLTKYRSLLRKQHVREKMTLREHVRELEKKKAALRGGKNVAEEMRREKRDLGKYIKQLEEEQKQKHGDAMKDIDIRMAQIEATNRDPFAVAAERSKARYRQYMLGSASKQGIYQSGLAAAFSKPTFGNNNNNSGTEGDNIAADELKNMFAHLM